MTDVGQEDALRLGGIFSALLVAPGLCFCSLGLDFCLLSLLHSLPLCFQHAGIFTRNFLYRLERERVRVADTDLVDEELENSDVPVGK